MSSSRIRQGWDMAADVPRVFVSYAHESGRHTAQVLALATFLRDAGVAVVLDLWAADTRQDWYSWAIRELAAADFVLVVASARYRATGDGNGPADEHRGVQSEAALLREFVYGDRVTWLPKILPVVLPGHTADQIPLFLQPHTATHFPVTAFDPEGAADLLRVLHRRPGHSTPAPGPLLVGEPARAHHARALNQINGTVNGTVVQADVINGNVVL